MWQHAGNGGGYPSLTGMFAAPSDTSDSLPASLLAHAHPRLPDVLPQVQPFCRVLDSCNDTCTNGPDANTTVEGLRSCRCACVKTGWQCSVNAGCSPTQAASVFAETCAAERCAPAECAGPAGLAPSPSQRPIDVPGNTRLGPCVGARDVLLSHSHGACP